MRTYALPSWEGLALGAGAQLGGMLDESEHLWLMTLSNVHRGKMPPGKSLSRCSVWGTGMCFHSLTLGTFHLVFGARSLLGSCQWSPTSPPSCCGVMPSPVWHLDLVTELLIECGRDNEMSLLRLGDKKPVAPFLGGLPLWLLLRSCHIVRQQKWRNSIFFSFFRVLRSKSVTVSNITLKRKQNPC